MVSKTLVSLLAVANHVLLSPQSGCTLEDRKVEVESSVPLAFLDACKPAVTKALEVADVSDVGLALDSSFSLVALGSIEVKLQ